MDEYPRPFYMLEEIMTKAKAVFKEEHDKEAEVKKVRKITIE